MLKKKQTFLSSLLVGVLTISFVFAPAASAKKLADESDIVLTEEAGLVPGDFFYFADRLLEDIHLALTVNPIKEAKLLASYSAERVAEANQLIDQGKDERAVETLHKAVETEEKALQKMDEAQKEDAATIDNIAGPTLPPELVPIKDSLTQNLQTLPIVLAKVSNPNPLTNKTIDENIKEMRRQLASKVSMTVAGTKGSSSFDLTSGKQKKTLTLKEQSNRNRNKLYKDANSLMGFLNQTGKNQKSTLEGRATGQVNNSKGSGQGILDSIKNHDDTNAKQDKFYQGIEERKNQINKEKRLREELRKGQHAQIDQLGGNHQGKIKYADDFAADTKEQERQNSTDFEVNKQRNAEAFENNKREQESQNRANYESDKGSQ
ncbi:hypothetical protein JK635_08045 [Neobacillus sp. YIM B02564]|uniref:DUF5667 domain-containing protein n=1 Tax=Neobacillus paridis TaxID=2803862 RepID=A0ABS1TLI2_9BACI|nr:DUF5667 domain-containing protein [Neobacillus paridis]MBL4952162.1 hypothetical protein [Neobacillus paridis]